MRVLGLALGAGLCAGSLVGALEALYVLQSTTPSEYQAFGYAWTLYGLAGGVMGCALATLMFPFVRRSSAATTWCIAFAGVLLPLGFTITHHLLDRVVYDEAGVPVGVSAGLLGGLATLALLGVWMGANVLTKTPLRAVTTAKGAVVAWGGGLVLAWIFALSPAPLPAGEPPPRPGEHPELAERPDIILVVVDSLRADALGAYGAPIGATPNLDMFAHEAVVFDQVVASAAWTKPTIASLFTSLAASSHRCVRGDDVLSGEVTTLAEVLQARGYLTAGLPNSPSVTAAQGFGQGFAEYPFEPEFPLGAAESTYALSLYRAALELHARLDAHSRVERAYAPAETQLRRAQALLDAHLGVRSFLFVHLMEPHEPWFSHPYDGTSYTRADHPHPDVSERGTILGTYTGEVHHLDEELGAFFQALRQSGRYTSALIVVTADHGEELGDHGGYWHGATLADEVIRVPLLVKLPGNARGGTHIPWQVRQVDIAPTLVDASGAPAPAEWQGLELFPDSFDADLALLTPPPSEDDLPGSGGTPPGWRAPDWTTHPASRDALAEEDLEGYRLQALRRAGRKVVEALRVPVGDPRSTPTVAYFDLLHDPRETTNLSGGGSGDEAAIKATLESMVADRRRKAVGRSEVDPVERCRLCALGYTSGVDCEDCPMVPH